MKTLLIFSILIIAFIAFGFPTQLNTATNNLDKLSMGDWQDAKWVCTGSSDQTFQIDFTNGTGNVTMTNYYVGAKLSQYSITGDVTKVEIPVTATTTTANRVTFSIGRASLPSAGNYRLEIWVYEGANTNDARTFFQGMLNIGSSLFDGS